MNKLFQLPQSWEERVFDADNIWSQVRTILAAKKATMPEALRRPDIRLIVNNTGGLEKVFRNPAKHAGDKAEKIPSEGDKTAAMVMLKGDTLADQQKHAQYLFDKFSLGEEGLSSEFVQAIAKNAANRRILEAYGPAPYASQTSKLVTLNDWIGVDGKTVPTITPVFGEAASYGARPATCEKAFLLDIELYVQGTQTTAELVESSGMVIAITENKDKPDSTRPIVASVAREFYGAHFNTLPKVVVHPSGYVTKIDLQDGKKPFRLATSQLPRLAARPA